MAYESPVLVSVIGNSIRVGHPVVPPSPVTYLTTAVVAAGVTLSVRDNNGFIQNDLMLIGNLGFDKTEIKQVNAAVTAGTSLTSTALTYDHNVDTPVAFILWDQVEISGASSISGSKTVITTMSLQPDRPQTLYVNTGTTYAYYFARYKNSVTTTFSSYSDAAIATGYPTTSVRQVKDTALAMISEKLGGLFSDDFLNNEIFNCEQDVWARKKRWSWAYTFDYILGATTIGQYSIALPSDISDPESDKAILAVRIGSQPDLIYLDKAEFDQSYQQIDHSTLATSIIVGATSIIVNDSSDFLDSGSVTIGENSYTYTANDRTTNTLTITASTTTNTAGEEVWYPANFGEPAYFTAWSGNLYFDIPIAEDIAVYPKNVYLSYYRKPTTINSDSDTLNIPDFIIYHYYLAWKCMIRRNNGVSSPDTEAMRGLYEARVANTLSKDRTGQYAFMTPRLNSIKYPATNPFFARVTNSP